ncbi:MAG: 23S rRNA (adenine(2503)-C(2))-methyltransferase RlmN [Candidatus Omnitrophica bacterium]|nr:23S rRNA (adenine(2503)-C(2))-methyltransferase RlmN [Candidatus Omnitrophota bacterium]
MKKDLKNFTLEELGGYLAVNRYPGYHAQQVLSWVYQKKAEDFSCMSNIPAALRKKLQDDFYLSKLNLIKRLVSRDGTRKYLFELEDKNTIESVLIPHKGRNTVCLSTQVGCKYCCRFCASGAFGFARDLSQAEILNQILGIGKDIKNKINNIVFMGMGEPLDNYDALLRAIRIINAKYAFYIGQRKITISTAGLVEGIKKLAREGLQIELSISLHSAVDAKRDTIIPLNMKYSLNKLLPSVREFAKLTKRKVTFEYILLGGFNTAVRDAQALLELIRGLDCKINLIPFNDVAGAGFLPPAKLEVLFFRDYLLKYNIDVTIRQPRGQDIEAACGQLRMRHLNQ